MAGKPPAKDRFRRRFLAPFRSRSHPTPPSSSSSLSPASTTTSVSASVKVVAPTPLPSTPPFISKPSTSQRLLQDALKALPDQDRILLQNHIPTNLTDGNVALDQTIAVAQAQQRLHIDKRWTFRLGDRTVTLREEADKLVRWLNRFKAVGDVVANVDPVHIGLPWAGIRLLLEIAAADANRQASLLVGCELALYMGNRIKAYVEFYNQLPQTQALANFDNALVQLYSCVLGFLAGAIRSYRSSLKNRIMTTLWRENDIVDFETRCDKLASRVEVEASNCDRAHFEWHLQQTMRELQKIRGLQESLDHMEIKIDLDKLPYAAGAAFDAYGASYETCHPQTRVSVLSLIMDWIRDPDGKRIFWLNGMAGTGKSTISFTVADRLRSHLNSSPDNAELGASFFFKRGEGDRGSAVRFFPTIARQLVVQVPQLGSFVASAISAEPDVCDKLLSEQFDKLIYRPLQALSTASRHRSFPTLVVVVDALDECDRHEDIATILRLWPRLTQLATIQLKLFLTGRPDSPVLKGFATMPMRSSVLQDMVLSDIPEVQVREDITVYLRDQFSSIRNRHSILMSIPEDWPSEQDFQDLVELSVPLFISAATACRFIGNDLRWDPQERLEKYLRARGRYQLSQIEQTYLPVMTQLIATSTEHEDQLQVHEEFRVVVGSIILLSDPLSLNAIAKLLKIRPSDVRRCLHSLHSVLRVPSAPDTPIRLLHLSFRDFLLSEKSQSKPYGISGSAMHGKLLENCISLLNGHHGLREDLCNLGNPGKLRRDVYPGTITRYLPTEIQYACRYWVYHAQQTGGQIDDGGSVHTFLQAHFLHWLEALSLMGRLSTMFRTLSELRSITVDGSDLSALLEDARRFVLAHRHVIDLSPLQVYSSALMFSPQSSIVRAMDPREIRQENRGDNSRRSEISQADRLAGWIRVCPVVQDAWGLEMQKLEGHTERVSVVAFSVDSQLLASASYDETVRIWNVSTGQEVLKLQGHTDAVSAVAFSPVDNRLLASASWDRTIVLWDADTGQEMEKLNGHLDRISAVAFSSLRRQLLASASWDRTIKLWDVTTGKEILKLEGHDSKVMAVAFSPSNIQLLASASWDRTIRLWNVNTGREVQQLRGHTNKVVTVEFSPLDGQILASTSWDHTVRLWDVATGQEMQPRLSHSYDINAAVFSPDGQQLALISDVKTIRLWDVDTNQEVQKLEGHTDRVSAVAFSPNGQLLASASHDETVRLWDTGMRQEVQKQEGHSNLITTVVFSPNGQLLASASRDQTIRMWDPNTGQVVQKLEGHTNWITAVAFSPDGRLLASASHDETVKLWDMSDRQEVRRLVGHSNWVSVVAFSPNGQFLASGSYDETIRLWNVSTGREVQQFRFPTLSPISFNDDGTAILTDYNSIKISERFTHATTNPDHVSQPQNRITLNGEWVQYDGHNLLWLPHEYRTRETAVHDDKIAIGQQSGRVSFIKLDLSQIPPQLRWKGYK